MRIVFTSCCDAVHDGEQRAWNAVQALAPQHIVLLGDNIYMDYKFSSQHLNGKQVRRLPPADFARKMHASYARQWAVRSFQAAIAGRTVHAIWDDHDFAWNSSRGAGGDDGKDFFPADRRRISRALFQQFRDTLATPGLPYPAFPLADPAQVPDLGGIYLHTDLAPDVRLHLLDGRSFRRHRGDLLGEAQRRFFEAAWLAAPAINLLASGGTLGDDWKAFDDLAWLRQQARMHRILVLSGDVHELRLSSQHGLPEATASAMAQPRFAGVGRKRSSAFGVLDVEPQRLVLSLRAAGQELLRREIDRVNWPH